jgi:hypothetical protein
MDNNNFNFEYFYKWYSADYMELLRIKQKNFGHQCKFETFTALSMSHLYGICRNLYRTEILPEGLAGDSNFYEKAFFDAMEKEEIPMLSILSSLLHHRDEAGFCVFPEFIRKESFYPLLSKCLDILEKMGTDTPANGSLIFIYDNLILRGCPQNTENTYNLCKKNVFFRRN